MHHVYDYTISFKIKFPLICFWLNLFCSKNQVPKLIELIVQHNCNYIKKQQQNVRKSWRETLVLSVKVFAIERHSYGIFKIIVKNLFEYESRRRNYCIGCCNALPPYIEYVPNHTEEHLYYRKKLPRIGCLVLKWLIYVLSGGKSWEQTSGSFLVYWYTQDGNLRLKKSAALDNFKSWKKHG